MESGVEAPGGIWIPGLGPSDGNVLARLRDEAVAGGFRSACPFGHGAAAADAKHPELAGRNYKALAPQREHICYRLASASVFQASLLASGRHFQAACHLIGDADGTNIEVDNDKTRTGWILDLRVSARVESA